MRPNKTYRWIELLLLFVVIPASLALNYPVWIKLSLGLVGFGYVLRLLKKASLLSLKLQSGIDWKSFWLRTALIFVVIALVTTAYVWYVAPDALFFVPLNKPGLYVMILGIYTFLSVWPQEVLYRTFFINRYEDLFPNKLTLIMVNAVLFSLAHLFFRNTLVMVLTLLGGFLFAMTYVKFRSTTLVSVEHALYGNWLFTVGMGQMLAFPGMEQPV